MPVVIMWRAALALEWRGTTALLSDTAKSKRFASSVGSASNVKLSVLLVNHGYPPLFNAGSEIYTQTLALKLVEHPSVSQVTVMAREHDPFRRDFEVRQTQDEVNPRIAIRLINHAREAPYHRFINNDIAAVFRSILAETRPNVVHFGHLNHLSLDLPQLAQQAGSRTVYTLHDFWLMCPRGQFLVCGPTSLNEPSQPPWRECAKQHDGKCAADCLASRYATGADVSAVDELRYWTQWTADRMLASRVACDHITSFIAPSKHIANRFIDQFALPSSKLHFLPYGFDRQRLSGRTRALPSMGPDKPYVFGYIGRHVPAKGIDLLVDAAVALRKNAASAGRFKVIIFGRPDGNVTSTLQRRAHEAGAASLFEWRSEYRNRDIIKDVFDQVDCIVVPSIWDENSPLVIQEAQQARVPVITSERGGMVRRC